MSEWDRMIIIRGLDVIKVEWLEDSKAYAATSDNWPLLTGWGNTRNKAITDLERQVKGCNGKV